MSHLLPERGVLEGFVFGDDVHTDRHVFRRLQTTSPPPANLTQPTTTSTTPNLSLPTDVAALHSMINTLRAELNATTSVNTNLAASVAHLQAELTATISVNNHLAASVARLQAEQTVPTPTSTTPTRTATTAVTPAPDTATTPPTTAPIPCSHPEHPRTIASGRGAASPEVFKEIIKTNWHGRLGRTHMVDVDALSSTALTELDCLLRRKLHELYPHGSIRKFPNTDAVFASLAVLGLRLEDRSAYADVPVVDAATLNDKPTIRRVRNFVVWNITKGKSADYWQGVLLETLSELAKYRGLFDGEGYLKEE